MSRSLKSSRLNWRGAREKARCNKIAFWVGNKDHFSGDRVINPKAKSVFGAFRGNEGRPITQGLGFSRSGRPIKEEKPNLWPI
jgi:hypothetical protein